VQRRYVEKCDTYDKANLPFSQVHTLRHTGAMLALWKGVPIYKVSKILGHRDINMTYGVYGHFLQEEKAQALRQCEIGGDEVFAHRSLLLFSNLSAKI
jgi:integrase